VRGGDERMDQLQTTLRDEKNAMRIIVDAARKLKNEKEALEAARVVATARISELELQLSTMGSGGGGGDPLDSNFKLFECEKRNRELEMLLAESEEKRRTAEGLLMVTAQKSSPLEAKVLELESKLQRAEMREAALAETVAEGLTGVSGGGPREEIAKKDSGQARIASTKLSFRTVSGETETIERPAEALTVAVGVEFTTYSATFKTPNGAKMVTALVEVHDLTERAQKVQTLRNSSPPRSRGRQRGGGSQSPGKSAPRSPRGPEIIYPGQNPTRF